MDSVHLELRHCIRFFLDTFSKKQVSYGLVPDAYPTPRSDIASIAGTGFLFPALISAVEENMLSFSEAKDIASKTLDTLSHLAKIKGWFYHFYEISSGMPTKRSEISTIDTALLLAGAVSAGGYFGEDIAKTVQNLIQNIDFPFFYHTFGHMFSMSLERDGSFRGHWDRYAEQLLLYVLGASSENPQRRMDPSLYKGFIRDKGNYKENEFICSWHGSLFTYQFSHGYIDFRGLQDEDGVNWFDNSVKASIAAYQYAIDEEGKYKSFHRHSWGLTACANMDGYSGRYGSPPSGEGITYNDGTVAPCASIGSIVFTPKESLDAITYLYHKKDFLIRDYGLVDSYNEDTNFICPYYLAIDKGISLVMLENFLRESIWKSFMSNSVIQEGLSRIGIRKV
ncbi:MAG: hypothetical protein II721_02280 [Bacilli bacterium]|nr:hypothetical protein [Bacilli bacterium]